MNLAHVIAMPQVGLENALVVEKLLEHAIPDVTAVMIILRAKKGIQKVVQAPEIDTTIALVEQVNMILLQDVANVSNILIANIPKAPHITGAFLWFKMIDKTKTLT